MHEAILTLTILYIIIISGLELKKIFNQFKINLAKK